LSAEIYDPRTGQWSSAAPMTGARNAPLGIALFDGRVLGLGVAAPYVQGADGVWRPNAAEIYDPKTDRWSLAASNAFESKNAFVARLANGRVVEAGGGVYGLINVYDPFHDSWSRQGQLPSGRAVTGARMNDGRLMVLTAGGRPGKEGATALYNIHDMSWVPGAPPDRIFSSAVLIPREDGKVAAAGVDESDRGLHAEIYDPAFDRWTAESAPKNAGGSGAIARAGRFAVVVGGPRDGAPSRRVEVYDAREQSWHEAALTVARADPALAPLDDTHLLVIGGRGERGVLDTSEVVDLGGPESPGGGGAPVAGAEPAPAPPAAPPPETYPRKGPLRPHDFALVVGIDRYERLPPADFAENDALDVSRLLEAVGVPEENTVVLSGSDASRTEVEKYLEGWLPRRVKPDSRVYFFYSGHGSPDIKAGTPYLMPWDADASYLKNTALPLSRLYASLGRLPVKNVVAFVDACFSGTGDRSVVAPGLRPLVSVRAPAILPPRLSVLSAAASDQTAGSLTDRKHGLFTYYLLLGLSGSADANGDGHVTLEELYAYARRRVTVDARRQRREQTPVLTTTVPGLRLY
jgi:hypothetical protein